MIIRQEEYNDHKAVFALIEKAFENEEHSDHREQFLVNRLRQSEAFVPALSLVAEQDHQIVGYILFTEIQIIDRDKTHLSLALAPVAVLPSYQNRGIGGLLIEEGHKRARQLGYKSVVLLGHEQYYPRFGYKLLSKFGIKLPFDAPEENCMAVELVTDALKNIKGVVSYPKEFNL